MIDGTVAVVGASGFVGSAFVERNLHDNAFRIVPLIHSTGNTARLARHGLVLRPVDLLSPRSVADALRECTHVVNCSRGNRQVMDRGFRNLLDASLAAGITRFVHLSSVAVYGSIPPGEISEDREPRPEAGTYGATKLAQDRAVEAAVKRGLPAVMLCAPNISGPHSPFLLELISALRTGVFGLVDDGSLPCELVDIQNLVHAVRRALDPAVAANGSRIFVTDCSDATWRDVIGHLQPLAEAGPIERLGRREAARLAAPSPAPTLSLGRSVRHLLSSDVREVLRKDPLIARLEALGKSVVRATPARLQSSLRQYSNGERRPPASAVTPSLSILLVRQQLREVRYSCTRARDVLGYQPPVSFGQSMDAFCRWYTDVFGLNSEWWPLLKQLYP